MNTDNYLINCSNIKYGGALQVLSSFIHEVNNFPSSDNFFFVINSEVYHLFDDISFSHNIKLLTVSYKTSSLLGFKTRAYLNNLVVKYKIKTVFTLFGPSYWKPSVPHVGGVADGWIYYNDSIAFEHLSFFEKYKRYLINYIKLVSLKNDFNSFILETEDALNNFKLLFNNVSDYNFHVVGNTFNSYFKNFNYDGCKYNYISSKLSAHKDSYKFCYLAYDYPNKNIDLIKRILPLLNGLPYVFVLTLPDVSISRYFDVESDLFKRHIINLGPVNPQDAPYVYYYSDFLFFPSLLETFSASFPEAMYMSKPIIASNLSFSTSICKNSAVYFDPCSPEDALSTIIDTVSNTELCENLVSNGRNLLGSFNSSASRALQYYKIISSH